MAHDQPPLAGHPQSAGSMISMTTAGMIGGMTSVSIGQGVPRGGGVLTGKAGVPPCGAQGSLSGR